MLALGVVGALALLPCPTHAATKHTASPPCRRCPTLLAATDLPKKSPLSPPPPSPTLTAAVAKPRPAAPATRPGVLLAVLLALYVSNQWARNLPSYIVNFAPAAVQEAGAGRSLMNVGLGFDQAQYGLLVSYGFSLLYTACSFPAGYLCDRLPRKRLLLCAALGWSAATAAQGAARTFSQVLLARVLLGVAQAFSGPAAHTLISDTFSPERRATANAIYSSGIYLGAALASLSVMLSQAIGWRATSFVVAAASATPALLLALVTRAGDAATSSKVPSSSSSSSSPPAKATGATAGAVAAPSRLSQVLAVPSVRLVLLAAAARLFSGFAIGAWAAPFYRTHFGGNARQFAVLNALVVAGGGTLSTVLGGMLSDRLTRGGRGAAAALVPALGSVLATPCWVCAMQSRAFLPSMAWLLAAYLLAESWFGATISFMQSGLPPHVWGTAQGLLNVVQIAGNASPLLIGTMLQRGVPLRTLLTVAVPAGYLTCALLFLLAARERRSELAAKTD